MSGLPKIDIIFKELGENAIKRSSKGRLTLILLDETARGDKVKTYKDTETLRAVKSEYTEANKSYILDALEAGASEVNVIKLKSSENFNEVAIPLLNNLSFDWVTVVTDTQSYHTDLVTYIKEKNKKRKYKLKALVYKVAADNEYIHNFTTESYIMRDAVNKNGYMLLARLAGILAGISLKRSSTYYKFKDIERTSEIQDLDAAIKNGELVLFNDDGVVRLARGVNSLTTLSEDKSDMYQSIAIVEAMDMIVKDVNEAFKTYIGNYKNTYDNQAIFISAISSYFKKLEEEEILDPNFDNSVEVDIEAQRKAWIDKGKTMAENWTDEMVKKRAYRKQVFLKGTIKLLDAVEDVTFTIYMI